MRAKSGASPKLTSFVLVHLPGFRLANPSVGTRMEREEDYVAGEELGRGGATALQSDD